MINASSQLQRDNSNETTPTRQLQRDNSNETTPTRQLSTKRIQDETDPGRNGSRTKGVQSPITWRPTQQPMDHSAPARSRRLRRPHRRQDLLCLCATFALDQRHSCFPGVAASFSPEAQYRMSPTLQQRSDRPCLSLRIVAMRSRKQSRCFRDWLL